MSVFKKYFFLFAAATFVVSEANGQAAGSPFSTFGIGDRFDNALTHNQGMAGVGLSNPQSWFLNNQNPALLVFNNLSVFEAGLLIESRSVRGDTTERNQGGNLTYLAMAFPVKPGKWTTSLGLMPYTSVNYKLRYSDRVNGIDNTVTINEEGSGGLTQLYWSNGIRLTKSLSIGLKASYLFSSIVTDYSNYLDTTSQPIPFKIGIKKRTHVKDFSFTAGISYSKDSLGQGNNYRLSIGAVYAIGTNLKAIQTNKMIRTIAPIPGTGQEDTTAIESIVLFDAPGNIYIPGEFGFGISYAKKLKWMIGADMHYQNWNAFKSINKEDETGLVASWGVALGGEFTPDAFAIENFFKRITYRGGLSYEKCPFIANNSPVNDLGINFGFSIPTGRSSIDVAFKVGKRGNKTENLLSENYFKIFFGLTLNDQWFIKRKFD